MNIILIGMAGAGKSTLGVLLAKALGMDYLDTDIVIQQRTGRLLGEIIESEGLEAFLKMEEQALLGLEADHCVIATGGSAVYSDAAMRALKENGRIVYLHVPYKEIEKRIKNIKTRGVVLKKGNGLKEEYQEREPLYRKYGEITVDCAGRDVELCVEEILKRLKQKNKTI
jgi:shikimate kinase